MTKLKFEVPSLDDVPEAMKALYEKSETGFRLAVEGAVSKNRLDEFRESNLNLSRERDRMSEEISKLLPPERVAELADKLAAERTSQLNDQLTRTLVDRQIAALAGAAGARPEAMDDVLRRGADVFKVAGDGSLVPRSATGEELSNPDGLLKPVAWLDSLKTTHPHYWQSSTGGGAPGAGRDDHGRFKGESKVKFKSDLKTPMEKSNYIREHGFSAFEALPLKTNPSPYQTWQGKQKQQEKK